MKKANILIGIIIFIIGLTGCSKMLDKGEIQTTKNEQMESFYGFFDTSYENESVEGVSYHNKIEADIYEEKDNKIIEKYNMIEVFLKENKIIEDQDINVFIGTIKGDLEEYFVTKEEEQNDEYYFSIYAITRDSKSEELSIRDRIRVKGVINNAKTSLFSVNQYLLISTEEQDSSYIHNYYLKFDDGKLQFMNEHSFDLVAESLERKITLLEDGKIDEALNIDVAYLYPESYKQLICKSNNLALKLFYKKAKDLSLENRWEEALKYLEDEVNIYLERAIVSADENYLNYFIESESECEYNLKKEEVIEVLTLYQEVLEKNTKHDLSMDIKKELDMLKK